MALHGDIRINGDIIFSWVAVRRKKKIDKDGFYTYDWRGLEFPRGATRRASWTRKGVLAHRYADGAVVLAAAVLRAYQEQGEAEHGPAGEDRAAGEGERPPEDGAAQSVAPGGPDLGDAAGGA
jgi:hypothetical protein